jgi:hypothetical protein
MPRIVKISDSKHKKRKVSNFKTAYLGINLKSEIQFNDSQNLLIRSINLVLILLQSTFDFV